MSTEEQVKRIISLQLQMAGGHTHELKLAEDSPELSSLFRVLGSRGVPELQPSEQYFQIPLEGGKSALAFNSSQLVSLQTEPPVVVTLERPNSVEAPVTPGPVAEPVVVQTPRHLVVDNFLSEDEHQDMLAFALANEEAFAAGTTESAESHHRKNLVILKFNEFAHSTLICNRLLTWFPMIAQALDVPLFPVESVESQLTASNDGHYYSAHQDGSGGEEGGSSSRAFTCVYYFFRQPRPFSGGSLRLYDTWRCGADSRPTNTFKEIYPVSNRLVVFPSETQHELMHTRCPSRNFADSRFAITNWIRRAPADDPQASFGWGHMRCTKVPAGFSGGLDPK